MYNTYIRSISLYYSTFVLMAVRSARKTEKRRCKIQRKEARYIVCTTSNTVPSYSFRALGLPFRFILDDHRWHASLMVSCGSFSPVSPSLILLHFSLFLPHCLPSLGPCNAQSFFKSPKLTFKYSFWCNLNKPSTHTHTHPHNKHIRKIVSR